MPVLLIWIPGGFFVFWGWEVVFNERCSRKYVPHSHFLSLFEYCIGTMFQFTIHNT